VVCVSKYASVDEAVKWTLGLIYNVKCVSAKAYAYGREGKLLAGFGVEIDEISDFNRQSEAFKAFSEKLETRLVSEIEGNNQLSTKNALHNKDNSVNLRKIVAETLKELGLDTWVTKFMDLDNKVSSTNFIGKPCKFWKHYKTVAFSNRQNKSDGIKPQQYLKNIR